MQEMPNASFASSEWKGVVGRLQGIETQGSYSAATRYSTSSSLSVNRMARDLWGSKRYCFEPHKSGNLIDLF